MREGAGENGLSPCKESLKSFLEMPLKFETGIFYNGIRKLREGCCGGTGWYGKRLPERCGYFIEGRGSVE